MRRASPSLPSQVTDVSHSIDRMHFLFSSRLSQYRCRPPRPTATVRQSAVGVSLFLRSFFPASRFAVSTFPSVPLSGVPSSASSAAEEAAEAEARRWALPCTLAQILQTLGLKGDGRGRTGTGSSTVTAAVGNGPKIRVSFAHYSLPANTWRLGWGGATKSAYVLFSSHL